MTLALRYAVRSDVGLLREGNEDSAYAGPHLLAVADGMGGHAAGEVASAATITTMAALDTDQVRSRIFRVERCDRRDGGSACHLAGRVASHAVRNREQVRPGVRRVFVPLPEETDIGPYRVSES